MSHPLQILFAVSGGSDTGMGHVMRCIALAREAHARGHRVCFALDGDAPARTAITRALPDARVEPWGSVVHGEEADWIVFDTRCPLDDELLRARAAGRSTLVLDTLDWIDAADLTVLPAPHAPELHHPRLRGGPEFCVLAPAVRERVAPPYPGARDIVLVTLGGADPLGLTARLEAPLARCIDAWPAGRRVPDVHVVVGPAFQDAEGLAGCGASRGWRVHLAPVQHTLAALMQRTLFACVGFGTTVQELAYLGVPMLYLTHHAADRAAALRLEGRGMGRLGGEGPRFAAEDFAGALEKSLLDPSWCEAASRHGRKLMGDGNGAARILDEIEGTSQRGLQQGRQRGRQRGHDG